MDTNDISACERLVMKVIWDSTEDLALQDIMNRVNQENGKSWKPQTVSTFLARLVKKSFLTVYRKGRYSFYQPAVSKEDFWKATRKYAPMQTVIRRDVSNFCASLPKTMAHGNATICVRSSARRRLVSLIPTSLP